MLNSRRANKLMLFISFDYFIMESAALVNSFNLPTFYLYYNILYIFVKYND